MKYIPADKLIAEIERLLKCTELHRGESVADGSRQTLYWMKDFITSLQQEQPEVDLEKEITRFFNQLAIDESLQDGVSISKFDLVRTARHFAEWGAIHLNVRKEE